MRFLRAWFLRLFWSLRGNRSDSDLNDELENNIILHTEENIQAGMPPSEARRAALLKFGPIEPAKEAWRDRRGIPAVDTLIQDLRYTFRMLTRNKGWAAVAILSLTLGIGVNTALFAIVNDVLLQKLAVPHPDELIAFRWVGENNIRSSTRNYGYRAPDPQSGQVQDASFPFVVFQRFQSEARELADLVAIIPLPSVDQLRVSAGDDSEFASGQFVSGSFHQVLGVGAIRGRLLLPSDDVPTADGAVVISHRYWDRRFGQAATAVGTRIVINDVPFTIVGISPAGVGTMSRIGADEPEVTIPLAFEPRIEPARSLMTRRAAWWVLIMGRLKPGTTPQLLQARLGTVFDRTVREEWDAAFATITPEQQGESLRQGSRVPRLKVVAAARGIYDVRPEQTLALTLLTVAVGIILLIVCLNLTNLLLSRGVVRNQEIVVRLAMGAARRRLVAQLFTESLTIAVIGGGLALLVAYWCRTILPVWLGFTAVEIQWSVVAFAAALTFVTAILFGLIPAVRTSVLDLMPAIQAGTSRVGRSGSSSGKILVVAQVALSLALLIAAGLYLRTLRNLQTQDLGFNPEGLTVFSITPSAESSGIARVALYERILNELSSMPNVRGVTLSDPGLLVRNGRRNFVGRAGQQDSLENYQLLVHHNYFETMGIPLRAGRPFTREDNASAPQVMAINQAFAKEFFGGGNPIGERLRVGRGPQARSREIVAIVGDAKYDDVRLPAPPTFFIPDQQRPEPGRARWFVVRTSAGAGSPVPAIRSVLRQIDPKLLPQSLSSQEKSIGDYIVQEQVFALTTTLFGVLALVVSMIGIFGLMSYSVSRRTREIGIRMALGAARGTMLRSVLRETLVLVLVGVVIGTALAAALTRAIASMLFGLEPYDPLTAATVIAVLILMALLAAYLPARRASRVDAMIALRHE
jgi:predicted permease